MTTLSKTRLRRVASNLEPGDESEPNEDRTLWKCELRVGPEHDEFLFKAGDDAEYAMVEALRLVDFSPSCKMTGAKIIGLRRVAKLWN